MSGNVKYRLEAYSAKYNDVYRVDIHEDGYAGSPVLKNIGAGKIVLSKSGGIIQKTTLSISIQADSDFEYLGFFNYDNEKYYVRLYKNGVAIWTGYQVAESYSEPYQNPPYDVVITATDGLGFLENYIFNNEELSGHLATEKYLTRLEAINACINTISLSIGYSIAVDFYEESMDTNYSCLSQAKFLATIFNGQTRKEVVEALLPYGTILTQHNNRWLIRRPLDDAEKTHILYTWGGDYFGTDPGETLLTMGDYHTGGVWPHGTPLLEMEHAWRKATIKAEYGKKNSFLENSDFSLGSEFWDDYTDGNFSVKKPIMLRPGQEAQFNHYYGFIAGYCPVSVNHYIEHTENIEQTEDDFIFEMQFDALAYRSSRTATVPVDITVNLAISIGSYYLSLDSGWSTTPGTIELNVSSSIGSLPDWKQLRIFATQVPVSGEISVKIYRIKYDDLPELYHIQGLAFANINVFTRALIDTPDSQTFEVALRENAVEGSNSFTLKPVNTPDVENAEYIFENGNYVNTPSTLAGNWSDNGQTAVTYIQAIANKMASYHKFVRHRISGCDWRGQNMSLNAIALHSKNSNRKFIVDSGSWNILDDTFNVIWVETGKNETATLTEEASSAPSASNSGSGLTTGSPAGHLPVIIASGSEAYLSISASQELSIAPTGFQSDWDESDNEAIGYINNKPTIPAAQIQSDWNQSNDSAVDFIKNKPLLRGQNYFLHNDASDISTYKGLFKNPADHTEEIQSVSIVSGDGETLIQEFATISGEPGTNVIEPGIWEFDFYHYVSNAATGDTTFVYRVFKRASGGTETELFNVETSVVTDETVALIKTYYAEISDIELLISDRLVLKVYAKTTSASSVTAYVVYEGDTSASHLQTPVTIAAFDTNDYVDGLTLDATALLTATRTGTLADLTAQFALVAKTNSYNDLADKPSIPVLNDNYLKDWIEFEFRDVEAGTTGSYVLDIKALIPYDIDSAVLQVDDGSLTDVSVKINGSAVTGLNSISATTTTTETAATGSVSEGNLVTMSIGDSYTGAPTLIRGKLNLTRT